MKKKPVKKSALSSKDIKAVQQITSESECNVSVVWRENNILDCHSIGKLIIELTGPAAHFPSTSNSREIGYRKMFVRGKGFTTRPFIRKSREQLVRLEASSILFLLASQSVFTFYQAFETLFGSEQVHVLALLAHRKGRFDSHNISKPIGDWLQSNLVIDDDSQAEIHCFKKSEYDCLANERETTTLIIQPRFVVDQINSKFIYEIKNAKSFGKG